MKTATHGDDFQRRRDQCLIDLAERNGGRLRPEDLLDDAMDPDHPYHNDFEWDDGKAAHEHRLDQARKIIRVRIVKLFPDKQSVRAWVSVPSDRRSKETGGYRHIEKVFNDRKAREELIDEFEAQWRGLQLRWQFMIELSELWDLANSVIVKARRKIRRKKATRKKATRKKKKGG